MYYLGFEFYKSNTAKIKRDGEQLATTVYRCTEREKKKCPMTIWTNQDGRCVQSSGEHNHYATPVAVVVRQINVKAKSLVTANFGTVSVKASRESIVL